MAFAEGSIIAIALTMFGIAPAKRESPPHLRLVSDVSLPVPEALSDVPPDISDDDESDDDMIVYERELIASMKPTTGHDVSEWLDMLDASAMTCRDTKLDWLCENGLKFKVASWIERIHANGGRSIYNCGKHSKRIEIIGSVHGFMTSELVTCHGRVLTCEALYRRYKRYCRERSIEACSPRKLQCQVSFYPDIVERKRDTQRARGRKTLYRVRPVQRCRRAA